MTNKSEAVFRTNFEEVCKKSCDFGINTLICQVNAFGDAAYKSSYYTWSQMVSGVGKDPGYDPLKTMVEIAHKYNLSLHAWINPFRTFRENQISKVPSDTVFKKWYNNKNKNGKNIVKVSERWYYNPGEPEVRELILNGIVEIISNYNVDGIHFDDYFYPTTAESFDKGTYLQYGNGKSLSDFRRSSVTELVKNVYTAVKKINPNVVFGISPQANVDNNMNMQYADVKLWAANNGYVDYLCPQVYYNYDSESLSFSKSLDTWDKLVTASDVKLMIGLGIYRVGYKYDTWACLNHDTHTEATVGCGAYGWRTKSPTTSNILARQCLDSFALKKCSGVFLYSYQYLFEIDKCFSDKNNYVDKAVLQAKTEMQNLKEVLKK